MFDLPDEPFAAREFRVRLAREPWEVAGHHRLRRAVFCDEQGLFDGCDRDAADAGAVPIVAMSCMAGHADQVVGTVRIHEASPGLWWGSRLAVDPGCRGMGRLGPALIRLAACSARLRGCHTFLAHVQSQNVALFRRLHWQGLHEVALHGLPHWLMRADLAHYPAGDARDSVLLGPPSWNPAPTGTASWPSVQVRAASG